MQIFMVRSLTDPAKTPVFPFECTNTEDEGLNSPQNLQLSSIGLATLFGGLTIFLTWLQGFDP